MINPQELRHIVRMALDNMDYTGAQDFVDDVNSASVAPAISPTTCAFILEIAQEYYAELEVQE